MIGTDIVKISRFEKNIGNERLLKKLFSDKEITFFNNSSNCINSMAGAYAAKEAFSKAIGTGFSGFLPNRISVLHKESGMPYFEFDKELKAMLQKNGYCNFDLSISHEEEYAIAVVRAYNNNGEKHIAYKNAVEKFNKTDVNNIITPEYVKNIITKRKTDMHKGDAGRILIIAGSKGLTGAAILASRACLKSGGGLITLACSQSLNSIFEASVFEVMTMPVNDNDGVLAFDDYDKILKKANECDAVLIGPGLTVCEDTTKLLLSLIKDVKKPLVIDADGINILSQNINILNGHKQDIIITPHIGEFSRLTGIKTEDILKNTHLYAQEVATKYNLCVVLKSHNTVVAMPKNLNLPILTNTLGNPGMATGGTGDVLSGVIASFTAQFKNTYQSATAGVYIHSLSADMASFTLGEYGLTPSDIVEHLPYAIKYSIGGI